MVISLIISNRRHGRRQVPCRDAPPGQPLPVLRDGAWRRRCVVSSACPWSSRFRYFGSSSACCLTEVSRVHAKALITGQASGRTSVALVPCLTANGASVAQTLVGPSYMAGETAGGTTDLLGPASNASRSRLKVGTNRKPDDEGSRTTWTNTRGRWGTAQPKARNTSCSASSHRGHRLEAQPGAASRERVHITYGLEFRPRCWMPAFEVSALEFGSSHALSSPRLTSLGRGPATHRFIRT